MRPETLNRNKDSNFYGPYAGRDLYITMFQESEREFVVTHNADIKPVSYFTGRETELEDLRQRIEGGRKSVLVSGMGGIGKTHICRKLFEEYLTKHAHDENAPFCHIGYIEYSGDMGSSLMSCLKYRQQDSPEKNQEAAWRELEYLAAAGKLLLFVDNVNMPIGEDAGLERLKQIPGAVVLTSRRTSFSKEFEPYRIGFLSTKQCIKIYERIRYEDSVKKVSEEEILDLEYVIEEMAAWHTITVEFLAHLAETRRWNVKRLRSELETKGFRLKYRNEEEKLINIQEEYEKLYDLSLLTEAEKNILEAFSVFPYIPLAAETCNQWLLADAGVGEEDDVLVGLYRKGWLQIDMEQESYSMHPVFAQFIYEKCKPKMEKHIGLIRACEESIPVPFESLHKCYKFIPFAISLFEKVDLRERIVHSRLTDRIALWFRNAEIYEEAEKWYRGSYDIFKEMKGEYHPITLRAYMNLTEIHEKLGDYESVEMEYKEILEAWEYVPENKKDFNAIAVVNENLASLYFNQGRHDEVEEQYDKILNILDKIFRRDSYGLAAQYHMYAEKYDMIGKYDKSEGLYEKCLTIRKDVLKANSLSVMSCYYELWKVYMRHGKYQNALNCFREFYNIGTNKYEANFSEFYDIMKEVYSKENLNDDFDEWIKEKINE